MLGDNSKIDPPLSFELEQKDPIKCAPGKAAVFKGKF